MSFAEFLRQNKSKNRKYSNSNIKKVDGVPGISSDDVWATETEWDKVYNESKGNE